MGTHWELEGNMLGNEGKMKKILIPHKKVKRKKITALSMHVKPSH
jgi:hypothetical protein